jgi:hypothetical protein
VRIAYARSLGVYEVLAADKVVLTRGALDVVEGAPAPEAPAAGTRRADVAGPAEPTEADEPTETDEDGDAE